MHMRYLSTPIIFYFLGSYVFKTPAFISIVFFSTDCYWAYTHGHHNSSTSLIDLVFVSNPVLTNFCHVLSPLSNVDHNGIHVQCSWKSTAKHNCENHSKGRVVLCYQADWRRASTSIDSFDWNSLPSEDVNETWSKWCQQFLSIMKRCIPRRTLPKRKNLSHGSQNN